MMNTIDILFNKIRTNQPMNNAELLMLIEYIFTAPFISEAIKDSLYLDINRLSSKYTEIDEKGGKENGWFKTYLTKVRWPKVWHK